MDELRRLKARLKKDKYRPLMERLCAIQDERDPQEERDVANLRAALKAQGLLPPEYDEYHRLRRCERACRELTALEQRLWLFELQNVVVCQMGDDYAPRDEWEEESRQIKAHRKKLKYVYQSIGGAAAVRLHGGGAGLICSTHHLPPRINIPSFFNSRIATLISAPQVPPVPQGRRAQDGGEMGQIRDVEEGVRHR